MFTKLTCLRCDHVWGSRLERKPRVCPKCKSPYWYKKRIKEIARNNRDDLRTYQYLKSSLARWGAKAMELIAAAERLEREPADTKALSDEHVAPFHGEQYLMLVGFALENFYKGSIVGNIVLNNAPLNESTIDQELKDHDLCRLAAQAKITLDNQQKENLDFITECVLWLGRYPCPTSFKELKGCIQAKPEPGFMMVTSTLRLITLGETRDLLNQARDHLVELLEKVRNTKNEGRNLLPRLNRRRR